MIYKTHQQEAGLVLVKLGQSPQMQDQRQGEGGGAAKP